MNAKQIFVCFAVSLFAVFVYFRKQFLPKNETLSKACYLDLLKNVSICSLVCPYGTFALPGMSYCHPWLNCEAEISLVSTISISVVKTVYLGKWKDYEVALSVLNAKEYEDDFKQNLFMIKALTSNPHVVQLVGYCNNNIITQYYKLGSALNANYHLKHSLRLYNNVENRLNLCISYVSIIQFLHSSPTGIRVMCDSSTLEKTLSQYLLREDLTVVINDLDATPQVDIETKKGVVCGNRALTGLFVAPEQLWPFTDEEFSPEKMPLYDEKTDIWKIPDVCNWFLGDSSEADIIKYKLFRFHKNCKDNDPLRRPNANVVFDLYRKVLNDLG